MPLALKVVPELDEHALDSVRHDAENIFDTIGQGAGGSFLEGLTRGMGGSGGAASAFTGVTAAAGEMGTGIVAAAAIGVTAVAGLAVAAEKVGEALYGVGARFDAVFDNLAIRTGKVGADFDALSTSVERAAGQTASSLEKIGDVTGQLSVGLGLSGQSLENLTKQVSDLDRMTGTTTNIRTFSEMLRAFGDVGDAAQNLDTLNTASQQTLVPVNELLSTLQNLAPAAQTLGLDLDRTTAFIVAMTQAGVDANTSTMALNSAAKVFADNNVNLKTGLADTITQIRGFIDAGRDAEAIDLAGKVFGERGAERFVQAIRDGALNVNTLNSSLSGTGQTIEDLNNRTADWAENWTILKNRASDLAETVGGPLFDALNGALGLINKLVVPVELPQGPSGPPPLGYTPPTLPGMMGVPAPGGSAPAPGGLGDVPPWMQQILPTTPPGGFPGAAPPQDIAAAVADAAKGGGAGGPVVPFGPMPQLQPGESAAQYNAEVNVAEARNELEQKKATLNAIEGDNTKTADEIQKAKNDVIAAETRNTQAQLRLNEVGTAGSVGTAQVPYGPGYGAPPRPGETTAVYNAEQGILEAQHKTAESRAQLQRVEADSKSTADQLIKARNDLAKAEGDEIQAQMRLSDAFKTSSTTLEEFGNKLDADLGLSEGLPGLAENLFRFLGNLAAAPLLGPLQAISAAQGGIDKTGSGAIGMLAQQGAFGPQYTPEGQAAAEAASGGGGGGGGSPSIPTATLPGSISSAADLAAGGSRVQALYALANSLEGTPYSQALRNDCSGIMSQLVNAAVGLPPPAAGQRFATPGEGAALQSAGFTMTGSSTAAPPGSFRIGWNPAPGNAGHTAGTLPGGENVEQGGSTDGFTVGPGAAGANSPQFSQHAYLPMGPVPPGYAAGGGIPIIAHAGEHMLTASDVSAMGGQVGVYNFRNALHMAGGGPPESPQLPPPPPPVQHMPTSSGRGSGPAPGPQPMAGTGLGNTTLGPGSSVASGQGGGPAPGPSAVGGVEKPSTPGGAISGGGAVGAATGAAAMAADMFAPGSGAAVQIASQEIQRAIKFGGQVAAIGVNGLMETVLPMGASSLAQNNWISRIAGGFAGVQPQIPNLAGKSASVDEMNQKGAQPLQPSALPKPISSGQSAQELGSPTVVNYYNQGAPEDRAGADLAHHLNLQNQGMPGRR